MPIPNGEGFESDDEIEGEAQDPQILCINDMKQLQTIFLNLERGESERIEVQSELTNKLPAIDAYYCFQLSLGIDKRNLSPGFINNLASLQHLIYQDFIKTKNDDLIGILLDNNLSPISQLKINAILKENDIDKSKAATKIKRYYRSFARARLHQSIFNQEPQQAPYITQNRSINSRLLSIINSLATQKPVISSIQTHWTTTSNLMNILRNGYLFGNYHLKKSNIFFQPNALCLTDVKQGDEKVICLCPYLVDHEALWDYVKGNIKDNLVRLSLNIDQVDTQGQFNQFIKLRDLESPNFSSRIKINDEIQIEVDGTKRDFTLKITLKEITKQFYLYQRSFLDEKTELNNVIFYGDIVEINKFCLSKVIDLINKDEEFAKQFFSYLDVIDENEIKKILVIIAQNLTIFAEYNFNASLKLTNHLIHAIHFANHNATLKLNHLSAEEYDETLRVLMQKNMEDLELPVNFEVLVTKEGSNLSLYGNEMDVDCRRVYLPTVDLTKIPSEDFSTGHYIETRPSSTAEDSTLKEIQFLAL